jgi:hypothetical protein
MASPSKRSAQREPRHQGGRRHRHGAARSAGLECVCASSPPLCAPPLSARVVARLAVFLKKDKSVRRESVPTRPLHHRLRPRPSRDDVSFRRHRASCSKPAAYSHPFPRGGTSPTIRQLPACHLPATILYAPRQPPHSPLSAETAKGRTAAVLIAAVVRFRTGSNVSPMRRVRGEGVPLALARPSVCFHNPTSPRHTPPCPPSQGPPRLDTVAVSAAPVCVACVYACARRRITHSPLAPSTMAGADAHSP